jgi:hypothetical protein
MLPAFARRHSHFCQRASAKSVEVATLRHSASSFATKAFFASMRSTLSLPRGSRSGGFVAFASLMKACASLRGSPRWP